MKLDRKTAEKELERAGRMNPGKWVDHSRFVAQACERIAGLCSGMSADAAYCFGLLHDIGRYEGVSSEKHLIDGYRFCMERGWEKAAQICDSLALPDGFCILEKRFVDVALRYGTVPVMAKRWKKTLEIREMFEKKTGVSVYQVLPEAVKL